MRHSLEVTGPVSFEFALALYREKRPFTVHLECREGGSSKFWKAIYSGGDDSVFIKYGRIGSEGTTIQKNISYLTEKVSEKLNKGYQYVDGTTTRVLPFKGERREGSASAKFAKEIGKEQDKVEVFLGNPPWKEKPLTLKQKLASLEDSSEW